MSTDNPDSTNEEQQQKPKKRRWFRRLCITLGTIIFLAFIGWWFMIRMPGKSYEGDLPPADANLDSLAAELRRDVTYLAEDIGERNVLNCPEELSEAADWIEFQFEAAGYEVHRQEYEVYETNCCNLEVEIPGSSKAEEIVVIGGHYDTVVGTPGANDNTTGVAATLALARRFSGCKPLRTLRFVAFVNEEPPFFQSEKMGSWVYANRCRERDENIVGMISLETIGYYSDEPGSQKYPPPFGMLYPSEGNFIGFVGNVSSGALVRKAIGTFRENEKFPSEGGALPAFIPGIGFSDQWSFWEAGYPAFMVTDTAMFRYPHYHEPEDTVDKVDFEKTARVVRGMEAVIGELVGMSGDAQSSSDVD